MNKYFTDARAVSAISGQNISILHNDAGYITGVSWGGITGDITNQSDLQSALGAKQNIITLGTTAQYLRGDLSLGTFPTLLSSFTNDVNYISNISGFSTSDLQEGSNLYYTQNRFDAAFGNKTTDNLTEGTTNKYFTNARAISALTGQNVSLLNNDANYISNLSTFTTTNLAEGNNLYFNNSRARSAIAVSGTPLTYNSSTGVVGINQANSITDGFVSSTDWNTFNNKFALPSFTNGSVVFANGSTLSQDNNNYYWDTSTQRLAIGGSSSGSSYPVSAMTSNSTPSPYVASASSIFGVGYEAYRAFDNTPNAWISINGTTTGWLAIDLGSATTINKYQIQTWTTPNGSPKTWTLEGSATGAWAGEQVVLDTQTNQIGWSVNEIRTFALSSSQSYRYYRLNISANNGLAQWVSVNALILQNTSSVHVSPLAKLHITAGSNIEKGLIVQGAPSQTANLQEWQDSTGAVLSAINSSGSLGIGTGSPSARIHSLSTSEQLRLGYDTSNFTSFTTSSSGNLSINPSGSQVQIAGNASLIINPGNGNLGVGVSSPTAKVDISDTALAGSGSLVGSALKISQTWNTTGAPTALAINITDTASQPSAPKIINANVGANSIFSVSKLGVLTLGQYSQAILNGYSGTLTIGGNNGSGNTATIGTNFYDTTGTMSGVIVNGSFGAGGITGSGNAIGFNSSPTINQDVAATGNYYGFYNNPSLTSLKGSLYNMYSANGMNSLSDTVSAGSGSLAGSLLSLNQTWNTTGAPTAIKLNVTNTASGAAAKLMDLQVGGASMFSVATNGNLATTGITNSSLTQGSVLFAGASGVESQDNNNYYWDSSTQRLAIGGYLGGSVYPLSAMTANSLPSPYVASASSVSGGYPEYQAFDRNASTFWASLVNNPTGWIAIDLGSTTTINRYQVQATSAGGNVNPKNWTLEGSTTGAWAGEQVILDTQTNQTSLMTGGTILTYTLSSPQSYRYFRLNVSANNGATNYLEVASFNLQNTAATHVSPLAKLHITAGSQTEKGLIVQGYPSQTANLQEWQDSSGNIIGSVGSTGIIKMWDGSTNANPRIQIDATGGSGGTEPRLALNGGSGSTQSLILGTTSGNGYISANGSLSINALGGGSTSPQMYLNSSGYVVIAPAAVGSNGTIAIDPGNPLAVMPAQYSTGTASQSGNAVTGVGTTFTAAMVGSTISFGYGSGNPQTITGFTDATHITVSGSQTLPTQKFQIVYTGLQVGTTGNVGIGTTAPTYSLDVIYNNSVAGSLGAAIRTKNSNSAGSAEFRAENNLGYSARMFKLGSTYGTYKNINSNDIGFYNDSNGGNISILNDSTTGKITLVAGARTSTGDLVVDTTGNIGIGTTSPSAKLHSLATTEQLRLGYDASDYMSTTIGSTGNATFALTGTGTPAFTFSNPVNISGALTATNITNSSLTQGSVLFAGAGGLESQDNNNYYWDSSTSRLAIGGSSSGSSYPSVAMTGNSTPSPYVASISTTSDAVQQAAYKAFDGNAGTDWCSAYTNGVGWLLIDLGSATTINKYQVQTDSTYASTAPKTWTFEGSTTGAFAGEQVVVDTQASVTGWSLNEIRTFTLSSPQSYRYYRINITAISTTNNDKICIASLVLQNTAAVHVYPLAKLHITAGSNVEKGLIVQGAASQSANLQEWQSSTGSILGAINSSGSLGIGTSAPRYQIELNSGTALSSLVLSDSAASSTSRGLSWTRSSDGGVFQYISASGDSGNMLLSTYHNIMFVPIGPGGGISMGVPSSVNFLSGKLHIRGESSDTSSNTYTGTNALYVENSLSQQLFSVANTGSVGIGTNTPTSLLQVTQRTTGAGTVTNTAGGTTVTGTNTQFTNTFKVGDTITIGGQTVAISAIASDTSMTTAAITNANTNAAYTLTGGSRFAVNGNGNVTIGNPFTAGTYNNQFFVGSNATGNTSGVMIDSNGSYPNASGYPILGFVGNGQNFAGSFIQAILPYGAFHFRGYSDIEFTTTNATTGGLSIGDSGIFIASLGKIHAGGNRTAASGLGASFYSNVALTASGNNDVLASNYINDTYNDSTFTGVNHYGIYQNNTAQNYFKGNVGIGVAVPTSLLNLGGNISTGAWTTNGIGFVQNAATYTDTTSSGTAAANFVNVIKSPTLSASSPTTYPFGVTLYVAAPTAGTNVTLTNKVAIQTDGMFWGGGLLINGSTTLNGSLAVASINSTGNIVSSGYASTGTHNPAQKFILGTYSWNGTDGFSNTSTWSMYAQGNSTAANDADFMIGVSQYSYTAINEYFRIRQNGNVGIGNAAPAAKLDIADTTLAGSGSLAGSVLNLAQTWNTTGAPTAIKLNVTNTSSGANANLMDLQVGGVSKFNIPKDGSAYSVGGYRSQFNGVALANTSLTSGVFGFSGSNTFTFMQLTGISGVNNATFAKFSSTSAFSPTSGVSNMLGSSGSFSPTSGTSEFNGFVIDHTINQTGGANGITRGIYINPTLTAVADYRAIETTMGNIMLATTSGSVSIGSASAPTNKLSVIGASGDTTVVNIGTTSGNNCSFSTTTGSWACASDIRLKHDISDISAADALAKLGMLNPVFFRYNWQADSEPAIAGFIAQDFEKVFPELVNTDPNTGYKSLSYAPLMPYVVKGLNDQAQKISDMDIRVSKLETILALATPGTNSFDGVLASMNASVVDGVAHFQNLFVNTIHVDKGIEMKDQTTGALYCVIISNGDWVKNPGPCDTPVVVPLAPAAPVVPDGRASVDTARPEPSGDVGTSSAESPTTTTDTTAPVTPVVDPAPAPVVTPVVDPTPTPDSTSTPVVTP